MNERIRELAEQAGKYARDYVAECKHYGYYMEHNEYELRFEEKFAELIVKECVGRIKLQYQMDESTPEWVYNTLQEDIKEYFGVEE